MIKLTIRHLTAVILLLFSFVFLRAQDEITTTALDISPASLTTVPIPDSLLIEEELIPDENLNYIFEEKLEEINGHWFLRNMATGDSVKMDFANYYPVNLPYSIYISRLQDIEQVIDMSYNNVVKNFIIMYTQQRRGLVEMMLGLSEYYFPLFEEVLDKHDLPMELKYLPIIESALNPFARSRAGANGLWQFMYPTGRQMKLEINSFVDERRDPMKSSDAAVRYLKKLHDIYGDWHLAIAAYNCGPGNVNRAIRRSGGKTNYWQIYYRLPRETRGYVPAFIAASYVMNYYKEHNMLPDIPEISVDNDTIMVNNFLHFDQIAATLHIEKEFLQALNPMYRRDVIPGKKDKAYPLVLPNSKIMEFIDKDTAVFAWEREKYFPANTLIDPGSRSEYVTPADIKGKAKIYYTVKSGDNVGFISEWFDVRTSDLRYWNNINRNLIRIGQKLVIYIPENQKEKYEKINSMSFVQKQAMIGKASQANTVKEIQPVESDFIYYTVRRGDTLWEIAQKYTGVSSDEIMRLNNLRSEKSLYIGQKLKIKEQM
ncbi:MAG: LysM peptidoglycan-binding domain-containing protein [Prolixibacteraceae bacterium]